MVGIQPPTSLETMASLRNPAHSSLIAETVLIVMPAGQGGLTKHHKTSDDDLR